MAYFKDLTGKRFGHLVAVKDIEHCGDHKPVKWLCVCDCGGERIVDSQRLQRMEVTDCGCVKRTHLIGKKFGCLTVIKSFFGYEIGRKGKRIYWECSCQCGKTTYVNTTRLLREENPTRSCGCASRTKHGQSKTKLYSVYMGILTRCYRENYGQYKDYGGRGISVCDEWIG